MCVFSLVSFSSHHHQVLSDSSRVSAHVHSELESVKSCLLCFLHQNPRSFLECVQLQSFSGTVFVIIPNWEVKPGTISSFNGVLSLFLWTPNASRAIVFLSWSLCLQAWNFSPRPCLGPSLQKFNRSVERSRAFFITSVSILLVSVSALPLKGTRYVLISGYHSSLFILSVP